MSRGLYLTHICYQLNMNTGLLLFVLELFKDILKALNKQLQIVERSVSTYNESQRDALFLRFI
jgi:hypothetical protein